MESLAQEELQLIHRWCNGHGLKITPKKIILKLDVMGGGREDDHLRWIFIVFLSE